MSPGELSPEQRMAILRAEQRRLTERRRAARLLDQLLEDLYGPDAVDYAGQLLHHNRDYGAARDPGPVNGEGIAIRSQLRTLRDMADQLGDGPEHSTCIETTGNGDMASGRRSWMCGPECDPCSGGRCPDPAAHAEGGHDV